MTTERVRIAVVSDIHASMPDDKGIAASYSSTAPAADRADKDAILSLERLILRDKLKTDYLVCCGDMANQADPAAMQYVWSKFNGLAAMLSAKPVATVGNHDIDSRHKHNDFDARGFLRGLDPPYPLQVHAVNHEFWSRNFVVIDEPNVRFLVLNSCAYHGVNPDPDAPEYLHGRISSHTLGDLKTAIGGVTQSKDVNLLICHHHPHKHQEIEQVDYSSMSGGEKLIDLLGESSDTWMVLHGHKHHPRLAYGANTGRPPLILGAGSLSAKLSGDLVMRARNQFYIVDFDLTAANNLSLDIAGQVFAWDYSLGEGWVTAKSNSGLPARSGFGYDLKAKGDAKRVAEFVAKEGGISKWPNVIVEFPELNYALPVHLRTLQAELKGRHSIHLTFDEHGVPMEFAGLPK